MSSCKLGNYTRPCIRHVLLPFLTQNAYYPPQPLSQVQVTSMSGCHTSLSFLLLKYIETHDQFIFQVLSLTHRDNSRQSSLVSSLKYFTELLGLGIQILFHSHTSTIYSYPKVRGRHKKCSVSNYLPSRALTRDPSSLCGPLPRKQPPFIFRVNFWKSTVPSARLRPLALGSQTQRQS